VDHVILLRPLVEGAALCSAFYPASKTIPVDVYRIRSAEPAVYVTEILARIPDRCTVSLRLEP
jgi:hypothetical protein